MRLYTCGYGQWPTSSRIEKLLQSLKESSVNTLVDIRHSPCSSQTDPNSASHYGPKDWTLRDGDKGIAYQLEQAGIEYLWLVELGNPQRNDSAMAVLRSHIKSGDMKWPVNRGFQLLKQTVQDKGKQCCMLCACKKYGECHRKVIAESFRDQFFGGRLELYDL